MSDASVPSFTDSVRKQARQHIIQTEKVYLLGKTSKKNVDCYISSMYDVNANGSFYML